MPSSGPSRRRRLETATRRIFFYGLFMDQTLLTGKGLDPEVLAAAVLPGFRIHIGERATLLRSATSRAYGIVMELREAEARELYSGRAFARTCRSWWRWRWRRWMRGSHRGALLQPAA